MLSQRAKDLFAKLELEYEPVALKYEAVRPVDIKQHPGHYAFCEYVRDDTPAAPPPPAPARRPVFVTAIDRRHAEVRRRLGL